MKTFVFTRENEEKFQEQLKKYPNSDAMKSELQEYRQQDRSISMVRIHHDQKLSVDSSDWEVPNEAIDSKSFQPSEEILWLDTEFDKLLLEIHHNHRANQGLQRR